ncbi:MAG: FG-GAP-like repeat-containing protein [Gemmatimonadota bacterium]|nr:FG-GAP-like repeat-containing protein [Gemmatimonadota bacterium]
MSKHLRTSWRAILGALLLLSIPTACSESPTDPGDGNGIADQSVSDYMQSLGSWAAFAPSEPDQPPTATGDPVELPPDTLNVPEVVEDEDGSARVEVIPNVVYQCTETPHTLTKNPQQIVMYNPDREILWAGSLIQGRSHRDGRGALLGLTIAERTPIQVSIPDLPTGANFREVANPSLATVEAAVGEMRGNATVSGLAAPSTITFRQTVSHSERQFALSVDVSGHYMGFSAAASADYSRNASETTITAHFFQRMFEVVVAPPQTPGAFFSDTFTQEKLQQQVDLGRIGPDNLPVYVSNIVYGRMMTFSITSSASEEELRGTLQAAYNSIGGGAEASISAKQRTILRESRISVTSLGGPAEATLAVIRSGDWSRYFTDDAPISSAAPLSYTFRNLSDGSIASVTEATEYNLKECTPRPSSPGLFDFASLQATSLGIPTPVRTRIADIDGDGDGRMDMVWNHMGATNQVVVGLSNGDGTFDMMSPVTHPESPVEGWANYETVVGDFNGDGTSDLGWAYAGTAGNKVYLGLGNGDGSFGTPSVRILGTTNVTGYEALTGDVNGDEDDDLIFNRRGGTYNDVYTAVSDGSGNFSLTAVRRHPNTRGWPTFDPFVGDVNADGRADLLWARFNRSYFAPGNIDGTHSLPSTFYDPPSTGASLPVRVAGDVDGDGRTDLVWADTTTAGTNGVVVGRSTGTGISFLSRTDGNLQNGVPLSVRSGDINGDGRADLLWNTQGAVNRVYGSLGTASGGLDFSPANQLHPVSTDWDQFTVYLADVNGNGRQDVIWNHAASENRIYVGISRRQN